MHPQGVPQLLQANLCNPQKLDLGLHFAICLYTECLTGVEAVEGLDREAQEGSNICHPTDQGIPSKAVLIFGSDLSAIQLCQTRLGTVPN